MNIEQAVMRSLVKNLALKERKLNEGQIERLKAASAEACRIVTAHMARDNDPLLDFVDQMCGVLGVDSLWLRQPTKRGKVPKYRAAVQWVMRCGVVWPRRPTLNEIGAVTAFTVPFSDDKHSTVLSGIKRVSMDTETQEMARRLLDHCEANGIKTHPRPDWAKEAA